MAGEEERGAGSESSSFTPLKSLDVFAGCGGEGEREGGREGEVIYPPPQV